ncbi:AzlD domain-containing protein [Rhodoferax sp.]|uniref:AzlD domain-containing protein n=1 Tax=Rhodoferax sp. TaxID=50421 RepID=UPI002ACDB215|nr:AzlD domain-containing protein [Rhodoferax sp.]MDZ7920915.1 AzlD domain-containing protein [Rhodoferax sp.]
MSLDSFFVGSTDGWTLLTTAGLACVTVIARSFFFITDKDWSLPVWAQRGLQYAPIAALSAVIVPEIVMSQGQIIQTLKDARLYAVAAGLAFFVWRRGAGQAVLGTIASGMAVYLPLHIGLGW